MPLIVPAIESKLKAAILGNLKEVYSPDIAKGKDYQQVADPQLEKLANAIAKAVSKVIIEAITQEAQVVPGQAVVGTFAGIGSGPVTAATVSPGKIL